MKNIWKKLRDCWLDFWEDDELDMDKKHLSQHDKRSLLYGGFMIGVATFGLFSIGIIAGNIWTNHQNQKDMEEFLNMLAESFLLPDDNGNCQAFFSLIRWFLGPAAENVLSKYGYAI